MNGMLTPKSQPSVSVQQLLAEAAEAELRASKEMGSIEIDSPEGIVPDERGGVRLKARVKAKDGTPFKNAKARFEVVVSQSDGDGSLSVPRVEQWTDVFGQVEFADIRFSKAGVYRLKLKSEAVESRPTGDIPVSEAHVLDPELVAPPNYSAEKKPVKLLFKGVVDQTAAQTFIRTLSVGVYDEDGKLRSDYTQPIQLSFDSNPDSVVLHGKTSVIPVNGIAQFNSLVVASPGRGFRFKAEAPELTAAVSNYFNVVEASSAEQPVKATIVDVYVMCEDATTLKRCPAVPKDWVEGWTADRIQDVLVQNTNPFFIHAGFRHAGFVLGRYNKDYANGFYNFGKSDTTKLKNQAAKVGRKGVVNIFIVNSLDGAGAFASDIFSIAGNSPSVLIPAKNFTLSQGVYYSDVMAHEFGHILGIHHLAANSNYKADVKLCGIPYVWTVLTKEQAAVCSGTQCNCLRNHTMSYAAVDPYAYKQCGLSKFFVEPGFQDIPNVPGKMREIMGCWNRSSYY